MINILSTIFLAGAIVLMAMPVVAGLVGSYQNPDACKSIYCSTS